MVVHWPARITDTGALRSHFTHVIDVGPTILDIAGIPAPSHVDGIEQEPLHGVYKDGWWLAMKTPRVGAHA
jgi:arylsulfatase A-like enzyme